MCEITWETIPAMRGDPVGYVLQVLVGRESEYKQVAAMDLHRGSLASWLASELSV